MFHAKQMNAIHEVILDTFDQVKGLEMCPEQAINQLHNNMGDMIQRKYDGPYKFKSNLWYDPMKKKLKSMGLGEA